MKEWIGNKWTEMQPESKRVAIIVCIICLVMLIGIVGYKFSRSSAPVQVARNEKKEIALDKSLLEKSLYRESRKEQGKALDEIKGLKQELEDLKKEKEQKEQKESENAKAKASNTNMPPLPALPVPGQSGSYSVPPSPNMPSHEQQPAKITETVMGDIQVVSAPVVEAKKEKAEDDKKKEEVVYLPPSFMEATLLSGLDAPTTEEGKKHPVPALLRIKDIAVLPNKVKADLKGCFVIANGKGNLATERAELVLVSLSCVSKRGKSVIDQQVKGFIVDGDGKIGLKGRVVAKMGAHIARSLVAGIFGGIGEAVRTSSLTTNITALGTTQQTLSNDTDRIAKAGVGGGISQAAAEIQKFYLDLARQTLPVIEVGATKPVTLVISEGVELKIKEWRKQ
ncbi:MAG: TraB/VirB10 family protein [Nitrospirae bacterium]|nr:TraB/VirB10 family protein [Nitrospirota bacterium]